MTFSKSFLSLLLVCLAACATDIGTNPAPHSPFNGVYALAEVRMTPGNQTAYRGDTVESLIDGPIFLRTYQGQTMNLAADYLQVDPHGTVTDSAQILVDNAGSLTYAWFESSATYTTRLMGDSAVISLAYSLTDAPFAPVPFFQGLLTPSMGDSVIIHPGYAVARNDSLSIHVEAATLTYLKTTPLAF